MLSNVLLEILARHTRKSAPTRKTRKLYERVHRWMMMKPGRVTPIVTAPLNDQTRLRLDLRSGTEYRAYFEGCYDDYFIRTISSLLNADDLFVDVGANIGFYTVAIGASLKKRGGRGQVFAFEPFRNNLDRLEENIALNALQPICLVQEFGLSDQAGTSELTLREDFKSGAQTGNAAIPTNEVFDHGFRRISIRLETLDGIWRQAPLHGRPIELMKMDIEGHEDFCLRGGQDTLRACRPTVFMEVNKPYYDARGVDIDGTFLPLMPPGYSIYKKDDGGHWRRITTFADCSWLDNVFLIPEEKLARPAYQATFITGR